MNFTKTGSEHLMVFFSGVQGRMGINPYEFTNITKDLKADRLFLKDTKQAWYLHDIDTITKDLLTLKANYKTTTLVGNSMGGYAALLFSTTIVPDKTIVFSPQTFLDDKTRALHKDTRWRKLIQELPNKRPNISNLLRENKTQHHIYFDKQYPEDYNHVRILPKLNNIFLHSFPGTKHTTVASLKKQNLLKQILCPLVDLKKL